MSNTSGHVSIIRRTKSATVSTLVMSFTFIACCVADRSHSGGKSEPLETAQTRARTLFTKPTEGFRIVPGDGQRGYTCKMLLSELERVTGVHFVVAADTNTVLDRTPVGLMQPLDVAPDQVWSVSEALLVNADFKFSFIRDEAPIVIGVQALAGQGRGGGAASVSPIQVPIEALPAWREHPAFMVSTSIALESLNVRDLSNSMRQMFTDPNSQQIIPVGNSNSLMLIGLARRVGDLANQLSELNARERARLDAEKKLDPSKKAEYSERQGVAPMK